MVLLTLLHSERPKLYSECNRFNCFYNSMYYVISFLIDPQTLETKYFEAFLIEMDFQIKAQSWIKELYYTCIMASCCLGINWQCNNRSNNCPKKRDSF